MTTYMYELMKEIQCIVNFNIPYLLYAFHVCHNTEQVKRISLNYGWTIIYMIIVFLIGITFRINCVNIELCEYISCNMGIHTDGIGLIYYCISTFSNGEVITSLTIDFERHMLILKYIKLIKYRPIGHYYFKTIIFLQYRVKYYIVLYLIIWCMLKLMTLMLHCFQNSSLDIQIIIYNKCEGTCNLILQKTNTWTIICLYKYSTLDILRIVEFADNNKTNVSNSINMLI